MLLVKDWASNAPQLEIVRIFANDLEKVAVLNQAIDFVLGLSVQQSASALLATAMKNLSKGQRVRPRRGRRTRQKRLPLGQWRCD